MSEARRPPVVVPAKHPPHYLMHKYWARKPHNLVAAYIEHHTDVGDIVLDPFSGSGVTAIEAICLRRGVVAVDLNPLSRLMVEATIADAEEGELRSAMAAIREALAGHVAEAYSTRCPDCGGVSRIAYCVWTASLDCPSCGQPVLACDADRVGRNYSCPGCSTSVRIPSSTVASERMTEIFCSCDNCGGKRRSKTPSPGDIDKANRTTTHGPRWRPVDNRFITNRRTLVRAGQLTSDFFTVRNFEMLCAIRAEIERIDDPSVRRIMTLTFTAGVAQASRLIPYRDNMTTGGPAWSVPGFWVPPLHLEMNAWDAFENRFEKTIRGRQSAKVAMAGAKLIETESFDGLTSASANAMLLTQDSSNLAVIPDGSVDYVFADPPYGDAVPYLEFSSLWLAWLDDEIDPDREIVVSDAPGRSKNLERYKNELRSVFAECFRVLKDSGYLTITFHNKSLDVWSAIASALSEAGFILASATYCPPAVVSSKAQLAPAGSMVGDVVLDLVKAPAGSGHADASSASMADVIAAALEQAICERGGVATSEEVVRAAVIALLKAGAKGIDHAQYSRVLAANFDASDGGWRLRSDRQALLDKYPQISIEAARLTRLALAEGVTDKRAVFAFVLDGLRDGSAPSLHVLESAYAAARAEQESANRLF